VDGRHAFLAARLYGLVAVQHSLKGLFSAAAGAGWGPTSSGFSKTDILQGLHSPAASGRLPTGEVSPEGKEAMLKGAAAAKEAAAAAAANGLLCSLGSSLDLHDSDALSQWWLRYVSPVEPPYGSSV
jgi:hypothetical protein